ncbi:hypothetical protein C8J57DRAFT_1223214 [Mycena rebaudengoi]|nr:hypothetical protein C8J57DRAFT_1223214 [Mycena rebaudengoi]
MSDKSSKWNWRKLRKKARPTPTFRAELNPHHRPQQYSPSSNRTIMSHTDTRPAHASGMIPANAGAAQTVQKSVSSTIPQGQTRYDGKAANGAPAVQAQTATVEDRGGAGKAQGK